MLGCKLLGWYFEIWLWIVSNIFCINLKYLFEVIEPIFHISFIEPKAAYPYQSNYLRRHTKISTSAMATTRFATERALSSNRRRLQRYSENILEQARGFSCQNDSLIRWSHHSRSVRLQLGTIDQQPTTWNRSRFLIEHWALSRAQCECESCKQLLPVWHLWIPSWLSMGLDRRNFILVTLFVLLYVAIFYLSALCIGSVDSFAGLEQNAGARSWCPSNTISPSQCPTLSLLCYWIAIPMKRKSIVI